MAELLVSVRSVEEACSALEGGAAVIDVKEPSRGALGRADDRVIHEIARVVGQRRAVSAALGEWAEATGPIPEAGLTFVKWGLAGCHHKPEWRDGLAKELARSLPPQLVLVAYADWECAQAPSVDDLFSLARQHPGSVMLVDTHCKVANNVVRKARPTLLDWLPAVWIEDLCARCRRSNVKVALAGSLGVAEIRQLLSAQPDWFAVRGAVCDAGDRLAGVQIDKVRQLVNLLADRRAS